jgi:hypothetical protein
LRAEKKKKKRGKYEDYKKKQNKTLKSKEGNLPVRSGCLGSGAAGEVESLISLPPPPPAHVLTGTLPSHSHHQP